MPADELDEEESLWARRLEETYQRAVHDEDQRGMQAAAKAGLSHIRSRKAERKAAAKAASDADSGADDGRISIGSFDDAIELFSSQPIDPISENKLAEALRLARALNRPDFVAIVNRAHENHEFAADLATWASCWEPAKKGTDEPKPIQEVTSAPN